MFLGYNLLLAILYGIAYVLSFFHKKLRQNFLIRKIPLDHKKIKGEVIWFHAASVGEYEQARILAQKLKAKYPRTFIFFTVYSSSAYNQRRNDTVFDYLYPLPVDFPRRMQKLLELVKPRLIIYAKYDVWPNLCFLAHKMGVKQVLISGTLPSNSFRLKFPFSWFFSRLYSNLDKIYAIHPIHQANFKRLKIPSEVLGDTRFDAVRERVKSLPKDRLQQVKNCFPKNNILIGGSTYPICEKWLLDYLQQEPKISLILAPHEVYRERIDSLKEEIRRRNLSYLCFSELPKKGPKEKIRVLLVDVTGVLPYLYSLAQYAYVGGAFGGKVHSVLEPAFFGLPILTGPHIQNSQEALDLCKQNLLTVAPIPNTKFLSEFINKYQNTPLYRQVKKAVKDYFLANCGATERILRALEQTAQLSSTGRKASHKEKAAQA